MKPQASLARSFRTVMLALMVSLFITIVLGGIIRSADTAQGCPDWPTCFGQWTLPKGNPSTWLVFDYLHRFFTFISAVLNVAAWVLAYRYLRLSLWLNKMVSLVLLLTLVQALLGGILTQGWLDLPLSWISLSHMALSMAMLTITILVIYSLFTGFSGSSLSRIKINDRSPFARLSGMTGLLSLLMLFSGLLVSRSQVVLSCQSGSLLSEWIICLQQGLPAVLFLGHQLAVALTGLAVSLLFVQAWRTQRSQAVIFVSITASFVLFWAQALLGLRMAEQTSTELVVLHQVTAVAFWAALALGLFSAGIAGRDVEAEKLEALNFKFDWHKVSDLFMLTKPVVVALLLVTTFAGMVIGGRSWPSFELVFWTMLAGFMAAGGSGAINQFIDRKDDERMQRTQKRPIPSGRLTPAEGLAFGVAMLLVSFFLMVAFVNLLAALLSLAGMIYYVLIYSILLKKTTVQNIVIGGGAGAIPPLVGWAAATGSLNVSSLFLFVIVFMWTPPHFWALALVRKKDYARAGVPMLPVVRGEVETRRQIFIYTIELIVLTLLLPLFGLGGSVYLVGAGLLGLWLFRSAWNVWKNGGNKLAWKMYRYSSMYLAFLFAVLMLDALM